MLEIILSFTTQQILEEKMDSEVIEINDLLEINLFTKILISALI